MPQQDTIDVLIIGAGPTGLTLACELARRGVRVRIVDKAEGPSQHSKALGVQARTLELLHELELTERMCQRGRRLEAINLYAGGKRIAHVEFAGLKTRFPYILILPQSETERLLIERLAELGVHVERQLAATAISQSDEGVRVEVERQSAEEEQSDGRERPSYKEEQSDGRERPSHQDDISDGRERPSYKETISARWVVGCDGAHSFVRKALGFSFAGKRYEETFTVADVAIDWDLSDHEAHSFLSPEGPFIVLPLNAPGLARLIVAETPEEAARELDTDESDLQHWAHRRADWGHDTRLAIRDPVWISRFHISRRLASRFRKHRVFLAGDAAHIHSPIGGQGMNGGIQDAFNLAWKLALVVQGKAGETLLDSYHDERHAVALGVLKATDWATRAFTVRMGFLQALRNWAAGWLMNLQAVQGRMTKAVADFEINYRKSPIVGEQRGSLAMAARPKPAVASTGGEPSVVPQSAENRATDGGGEVQSAPEEPAEKRSRRARPGDRAPDAATSKGAAASRPRIYDALHGAQFVLLGFSGESPTADALSQLRGELAAAQSQFGELLRTRFIVSGSRLPAGAPSGDDIILDPHNVWHAHYAADSPCLVLIRPDRYIAFRCQPPSSAAVGEFVSERMALQRSCTP